jgi:putative RNA 2'-phosphotransferase
MKPLGVCEKCGYFEGKCECGEGKILLNSLMREKVSKFLSGLLRHFPSKFGIEVDTKGWASIKSVEEVIRKKYGVGKKEIELIVHFDPKGRFQIDGDRIRARYGHSIDVDTRWSEDGVIPDVLYHGTRPDVLDSILEKGIMPMKRREVHLSSNVEDAVEVGKRYCLNPCVLEIDARAMIDNGIEVRKKGRVFTADCVPPEFIKRVLRFDG